MLFQEISDVEEGAGAREAEGGSGLDDAVLGDEPLSTALAERTASELAQEEDAGPEDPLHPARRQAREYVTRQFLAQHCPTWTNFVIDAVLACVDLGRPVLASSLPGAGATKSRDLAYEYRTDREGPTLFVLRQAAAPPVVAGISPEGLGEGGSLAPRVRTPIRFAESSPIAVLVSTARPDPALSGREDVVTHLFLPRESAWTEGPTRLSTCTRTAFAALLARARVEIEALERAAPGWDLARLLAEDLARVTATTAPRRAPSSADMDVIALAPRALRNLIGVSPALAFGLAELEYAYRRYEVLR